MTRSTAPGSHTGQAPGSQRERERGREREREGERDTETQRHRERERERERWGPLLHPKHKTETCAKCVCMCELV